MGKYIPRFGAQFVLERRLYDRSIVCVQQPVNKLPKEDLRKMDVKNSCVKPTRGCSQIRKIDGSSGRDDKRGAKVERNRTYFVVME